MMNNLKILWCFILSNFLTLSSIVIQVPTLVFFLKVRYLYYLWNENNSNIFSTCSNSLVYSGRIPEYLERWSLSELKILKDYTPFYGGVWCWGSLTSFFWVVSEFLNWYVMRGYKCWNTDSSLWISRQRGQIWGPLPRACCFWSVTSLSTYLTRSHKKLVSLCAVLFKRLKSTGKNKLLVICLTSLFYENKYLIKDL